MTASVTPPPCRRRTTRPARRWHHQRLCALPSRRVKRRIAHRSLWWDDRPTGRWSTLRAIDRRTNGPSTRRTRPARVLVFCLLLRPSAIKRFPIICRRGSLRGVFRTGREGSTHGYELDEHLRSHRQTRIALDEIYELGLLFFVHKLCIVVA